MCQCLAGTVLLLLSVSGAVQSSLFESVLLSGASLSPQSSPSAAPLSNSLFDPASRSQSDRQGEPQEVFVYEELPVYGGQPETVEVKAGDGLNLQQVKEVTGAANGLLEVHVNPGKVSQHDRIQLQEVVEVTPSLRQTLSLPSSLQANKVRFTTVQEVRPAGLDGDRLQLQEVTEVRRPEVKVRRPEVKIRLQEVKEVKPKVAQRPGRLTLQEVREIARPLRLNSIQEVVEVKRDNRKKPERPSRFKSSRSRKVVRKGKNIKSSGRPRVNSIQEVIEVETGSGLVPMRQDGMFHEVVEVDNRTAEVRLKRRRNQGLISLQEVVEVNKRPRPAVLQEVRPLRLQEVTEVTPPRAASSGGADEVRLGRHSLFVTEARRRPVNSLEERLEDELYDVSLSNEDDFVRRERNTKGKYGGGGKAAGAGGSNYGQFYSSNKGGVAKLSGQDHRKGNTQIIIELNHNPEINFGREQLPAKKKDKKEGSMGPQPPAPPGNFGLSDQLPPSPPPDDYGAPRVNKNDDGLIIAAVTAEQRRRQQQQQPLTLSTADLLPPQPLAAPPAPPSGGSQLLVLTDSYGVPLSAATTNRPSPDLLRYPYSLDTDAGGGLQPPPRTRQRQQNRYQRQLDLTPSASYTTSVVGGGGRVASDFSDTYGAPRAPTNQQFIPPTANIPLSDLVSSPLPPAPPEPAPDNYGAPRAPVLSPPDSYIPPSPPASPQYQPPRQEPSFSVDPQPPPSYSYGPPKQQPADRPSYSPPAAAADPPSYASSSQSPTKDVHYHVHLSNKSYKEIGANFGLPPPPRDPQPAAAPQYVVSRPAAAAPPTQVVVASPPAPPQPTPQVIVLQQEEADPWVQVQDQQQQPIVAYAPPAASYDRPSYSPQYVQYRPVKKKRPFKFFAGPPAPPPPPPPPEVYGMNQLQERLKLKCIFWCDFGQEEYTAGRRKK